MTIPIPQNDNGVEELLNRLREDRQEVNETDIDKLETEIDEAVYDLFDLTNDEVQVIEEYLETF
jgi:pyridoxine 5'-phosphate synthase PdxJ